MSLQKKDDEQENKREQIEDQEGHCIALPVHFPGGIHAPQPVDPPFHGTHDSHSQARLPLENPGHIMSQRPGKSQDRSKEQDDLKDVRPRHVNGHENTSGLRRATRR
jgi:hypothetical protein